MSLQMAELGKRSVELSMKPKAKAHTNKMDDKRKKKNARLSLEKKIGKSKTGASSSNKSLTVKKMSVVVKKLSVSPKKSPVKKSQTPKKSSPSKSAKSNSPKKEGEKTPVKKSANKSPSKNAFKRSGSVVSTPKKSPQKKQKLGKVKTSVANQMKKKTAKVEKEQIKKITNKEATVVSVMRGILSAKNSESKVKKIF